MRRTTSGSAFLLCLALAAFAAMIGYAFLRGASRQDMAGTSAQLRALARDAAESGLAYTTERILADYNARSLDVASGASGALATATAIPAPTHLDGPFRAAFVSSIRPYVLRNASTHDSDDVSEDNPLQATTLLKANILTPGWYGATDLDSRVRSSSSEQTYDGRGRFIEVNYHNATRPSPVADPRPVVPTRFLDAAPTTPERDAGLYLDSDLRRLTSGTVAERRAAARYRLRYAAGIMDLSGQLLLNPRASLDTDWQNAGNDYRRLPPWVDHHAYAMHNMAMSWTRNYWGAPLRTTPARMGHIFRGRGSSANTDRKPANPRRGLPSSFPMMFRNSSGQYNWYGEFANADPNEGGRLYSYPGNATWESIVKSPAGGAVLTPTGQSPTRPYQHALLGPQLSWFNLIYAIRGPSTPFSYGDDFREPGYDCTSGRTDWGWHWSTYTTLYTLFGRSSEANSAPSKWYHGPVSTPWTLNLLTAAPEAVNEMIMAYLPPHLKRLNYNRDLWYPKIGVDVNGSNIYSGIPTYTDAINEDMQLAGIDLLNDQVGSGFYDFPAPFEDANGNTLYDAGEVKPDYYRREIDDTRTPAQRYPGPLVRGNSANPDEGSDDLGKDINVDIGYGSAGQIGWCTHTGSPLLVFGGSDQVRTVNNLVPPRVGEWRCVKALNPLVATYRYSYFWDLAYALSTTISYARATWVQYPTPVFDPRSTALHPGFPDLRLRDPLAYDSMVEIDRLFLRQMGENFDAPGTPCPDNPIIVEKQWDGAANVNYIVFRAHTTPVSNTIRSLLGEDTDNDGTLDAGEDTNGNGVLDLSPLTTPGGVPGVERAKVMERMLNDFRMSYFGSSPGYGDFRPLDFDGDGKVRCSCYARKDAAEVTAEGRYKIDRWEPAVVFGGLPGRGPAPTPLPINEDGNSNGVLDADEDANNNSALDPGEDVNGNGVLDPGLDEDANHNGVLDLPNPYFTVCGNFTIGKSHFYRIFLRGEVFDNLLRKPVAQQDLEAVLTVDPEAPANAPAGRISSEQRVLFKQWRYNDIHGELPLQMR